MVRRSNSVIRIASDDVENQGPGTWIEVRRKIKLGHLRDAMEITTLSDDPRLKSGNHAEMVDAMSSLLAAFGNALAPLVVGWNWASDLEAELAKPARMEGADVVVLELASSIWESSNDVDEGNRLENEHSLYLGKFPEEYETLQLVSISPDGKTVTARGNIVKDYRPGDAYVVIGLPSPSNSTAYTWLGLEEVMWILLRVTERIQEYTKSLQGRFPKAGG